MKGICYEITPTLDSSVGYRKTNLQNRII